MTKRQSDKSEADERARDHQHAIAAIGKHVLDALGQPLNLHSVQVRTLWRDHYRVNVLTGGDCCTARVAHSFFLVADGDARVVASSPRIQRAY